MTSILATWLIALTSGVALCPEHEAAAAAAKGQPVTRTVSKCRTRGTGTTEFPVTSAGRLAKAWVTAFNSGDAETMRTFESNYRAASALQKRSIDERLEQYRELYADWGRLTVTDILVDGDRDITVFADMVNSTNQLEMDFKLDPQPPYKLLGIRIAVAHHGVGAASDVPPLDEKSRAETVNAIADELDSAYVYPETGRKMATDLRERLQKGEYDELSSVATLSSQLTKDLQAISHDKHLRVRSSSPGDGAHGEEPDDSWWAKGRWQNYGFEKVERLDGNVGYLKLNQFHHGEEAQPTAAAAMNFLSNTDALIIDLRENGGGSPNMIAFLSGYLFDERTHLNSFYHRPDDSTTQTWSETDVPGARFGQKKPVYVLTSDRTFSGAEEFAYNLKHLGRATIVGETTGGGAHPVYAKVLNEYTTMTVPFARAINPITKTNWEGVGVKPHVDVPASEALPVAYKAALEKIAEATGGEAKQGRAGRRSSELRRALASVDHDLAERVD